MRLGGGVDTGKTVNDSCFIVDSPQDPLKCRQVTPFSPQTQVKVFGSYPLPADVLVSAVFQNVGGPQVLATYNATSAEVAASLGRPLAGGVRTVSVPLVAPGVLFEPRRTQLDIRARKSLRLGSTRVQANVDVYNLFNAHNSITLVQTFGTQWRRPTSIMDGPVVQLSGQIAF